MFKSACEKNHSLHGIQILPIKVKYRAIDVEGNKRTKLLDAN